jgi:hypothetical protein
MLQLCHSALVRLDTPWYPLVLDALDALDDLDTRVALYALMHLHLQSYVSLFL